jgi:hypothetical protein
MTAVSAVFVAKHCFSKYFLFFRNPLETSVNERQKLVRLIMYQFYISYEDDQSVSMWWSECEIEQPRILGAFG